MSVDRLSTQCLSTEQDGRMEGGEGGDTDEGGKLGSHYIDYETMILQKPPHSHYSDKFVKFQKLPCLP